ncbi:MAG TPA: GNAT family N-acetyltransferase [Solirubrobacteraceae bacterium]
MDAVRIEAPQAPTAELLAAVAALLPQLSRSAAPPDAAALERLLRSPAVRLLVARDDAGAVLGMLTLALFPIPTGTRAWIEDVVVDESARGRGIAAALTQRALELAREGGARTVDLTSRPDRDAANRLYARLGFKRRETNVYRYELR